MRIDTEGLLTQGGASMRGGLGVLLFGFTCVFGVTANLSSSSDGGCSHQRCVTDFVEAEENEEVDILKMELLQRERAKAHSALHGNAQLKETVMHSSAESHSDAAMFRDFSQYVVSFGRSYHAGMDEYHTRHEVFKRNMQRIQAQNSLPARIWSAGVNHLTDRTEEELEQLLGWRTAAKKRTSDALALVSEGAQHESSPPEAVDWSHLEMASDVPDQDSCGSCWAFATTAMLQARYEAQNNKTRTFSAQQLLNCVQNPKECGGTGGCNGATVELAMDYISTNGLQEEAMEPYVGKDGSCPSGQILATTMSQTILSWTHQISTRLKTFRRKKSGLNTDVYGGAEFGLTSWYTLPENKAVPLMNAVADGPIAISVAANAWFLYLSGIFDGCGENGIINHAVLLFGYGKDSTSGHQYWNVRNSWGSGWGEKGFIRLLRRDSAEEENYCGIDVHPEQGIACKPYPETVRICGMCGILYDAVTVRLSRV